jgi:hypothetical protein
MGVRRSVLLLLTVATIALSLPSAGFASIVQEATTVFVPPSGATVADHDISSIPPGSLQPVLATLAGAGFSTSASADQFGNVGVSGELFTLGQLRSEVHIGSDEFLNPFSTPTHATANFIVDGGLLRLVAGVGSQVIFNLTLDAIINNASGNFDHAAAFQSLIRFEQLAGGPDFTLLVGPIVPQRNGTNATIPLSFMSLDLGLVPGNGSVELEYHLSMVGNGIGFTEFIAWGFSDPLGVREGPATVFDNPNATVPEPSTLLVFSAGLVALGYRGWRRVS